jgi:hypothetical protein
VTDSQKWIALAFSLAYGQLTRRANQSRAVQFASPALPITNFLNNPFAGCDGITTSLVDERPIGRASLRHRLPGSIAPVESMADIQLTPDRY